MKTKNITDTTPTDFQRKRTTEIHRNPSEQAKTEVYEYYERPTSCKKCLRYGHTVKRGRETIATCAWCSCQWHYKGKCTSNEVKCYHCGEDHQAISRNCPIFKRETEIVQIQRKERIRRLQAIRELLKLNPNPELIFSNAVKNTSNRNTSKTPSTSEQGSKSESSDDNSPTLLSYGHEYYTKGKYQQKRSPPSPPLTVGGKRLKKPRKIKVHLM